MAGITWISSYPKSGNTWVRFMLVSYLTREPLTSVRVKTLNAQIPVVGGGSANRGGGLPPGRPDPVLVKTHSLPGARILQPYRDDTRRAIYLVRNPRDVLLSLTSLEGMKPDGAAGLAADFIAHHGMPVTMADLDWGSWPQNVHAWTTPEVVRQHFPAIEVLTIRYEEMRGDPAAALTAMIEFLGLGEPVSADLVAQAVESTTLDRMRALAAQDTPGPGGRTPRSFRVGKGLRNQSLDGLGAGIEENYRRLISVPGEFSDIARQFGYGG